MRLAGGQVWVWLFNDLVLLGKPKQSKYLEENKRKTHCFTVVAKVGLGEVRLVNLSTVEGTFRLLCFLFLFFYLFIFIFHRRMRRMLRAGVEAFEVQMVEKEGMKVTKVKESFVLGLPTVEQKTEWMFGLKNIIKHFQQIEFVAEKKKAETEAKLGTSSPLPQSFSTEIMHSSDSLPFSPVATEEHDGKSSPATSRGLAREMSGMRANRRAVVTSTTPF
jgi:hypothetical protein